MWLLFSLVFAKVECLSVEGMTCGSCVKSITKAVSALPGVKAVKVDLEKDSAEVDFDEGKVELGKIQSTIDGLGYKTKPSKCASSSGEKI